jgi:hypothetical protein
MHFDSRLPYELLALETALAACSRGLEAEANDIEVANCWQSQRVSEHNIAAAMDRLCGVKKSSWQQALYAGSITHPLLSRVRRAPRCHPVSAWCGRPRRVPARQPCSPTLMQRARRGA